MQRRRITIQELRDALTERCPLGCATEKKQHEELREEHQESWCEHRLSATRTAMLGKTSVLMANAGSQDGFSLHIFASKSQADARSATSADELKNMTNA